jgi:hypothetical protein
MENPLEIKHIEGIRLKSCSNHADESNKVIILVLRMKELGAVERNVHVRVDNYTRLL